MRARLTIGLLLVLTTLLVQCTIPSADDDDDVEYDPEFRGFNEYESWKHPMQPAPEVILIKQKDPHHHDTHSIGSILKHNLPLWAVLAPLVAVSVLLPLRAYIGPSYVVYPPVTTAAPPSMRDRVGKMEGETFEEHQSMSTQLLNLIEEFEKFYGEMTSDDEDS